MTALRRPITLVIVAYWFFFWILNALDKVLARHDIGFLRWWGNDRIEKFTMYFDRLMLDVSGVYPTLLFAGIVELAVAGVFLHAGMRLASGGPGAARLADRAIALSIAVFLGFAVFDVIVGDRAELLEHSTYVGVLLISYLAIAAEVFFNHLQEMTRQIPPDTVSGS